VLSNEALVEHELLLLFSELVLFRSLYLPKTSRRRRLPRDQL
jgi:hypothetical protein